MGELEQRFKEASIELQALIDRRRNSWKLTSVMAFEDVSQEILAYMWKSFGQYDPSQPLDRWANTVITTQFKNLLRNHLYRDAKPCVAASSYGSPCVYNTGGSGCRWTKENPKGSGSGIQDCSCWAYAKWLKKKRDKQAIMSPTSLDDTGTDSNPMTSLHERLPSNSNELLDYETPKKVIDKEIMQHLNKEEAKIYRLLIVQGLEEEIVGKKMGYKKQKNSKIPGYLILREAKIRFVKLAKQIIDEKDLCQ